MLTLKNSTKLHSKHEKYMEELNVRLIYAREKRNIKEKRNAKVKAKEKQRVKVSIYF